MSGDFIGNMEWSGLHAVREVPATLSALSLHDAAAAVRRLLAAYDYADAESQRLWRLLHEAEGARSRGSIYENRARLESIWREASFLSPVSP